MESTPPTSKIVKTKGVRSGGRLEGWFSGDNDLIEGYMYETSIKKINNPKVVCFDWLKSQKLDNVRRLLKDQSLRKFMKMKGNIYPDLVRVFYTNLKFEGNNLVSHVKGVEMEITHEVWAAVTGLKFSGLRINKGNLGVVEDFNKIQYYKSCLKNQHAKVRTCSVGGLKLDERLVDLIVTWTLTPRGSNPSVITKEDLVYIFCIMKKIKINWIHIIKEHMQKAMRLSDYHYPYVVLVSKFLLYFEVNIEDETSELVKSTQELNSGSLSKMGFTKVGGKWISKDGDLGASSSAAADIEQDEPADMDVQHEDPPEDYQDDGPSANAGNQEERMQTMSPFERLMVNRLDSFAENQRNLHDLCVSNFQRFDSMDAHFMTLDE